MDYFSSSFLSFLSMFGFILNVPSNQKHLLALLLPGLPYFWFALPYLSVLRRQS